MNNSYRSLGLCTILLLYCSSLLAKENPNNHTLIPNTNSQLLFLENKGQITDQHQQPRKDIDYKLDGGGVTIFVGSGQLHYQWVKQSKAETQQLKDIAVDIEEQEENEVSIYRMDVTLVGANQNATPIAEELHQYQEHYYLPQCRDGATARSYQKITYRNIYPNIDWVLYSNGKELKYDFVIHQGGNVKDIQLRYDGATNLNITDGALTATTPYGSVSEAAPYTYDALTRAPITSNYQLDNNILSYHVANSDATTLVIDPSLGWATYYGGTGYEHVHSLASDSFANVYILGMTTSNSNIATTGAYQTTLQGTYNLFLAKLNSAGARLWGTYYNSLQGGYARSYMSADQLGNLYLATTATDTGLATAGAHQDSLTITHGSTINAGRDGILVKFNTNGVRQWATYYGADGNDNLYWVTTDRYNNVFIAGGCGASGSSTGNNVLATSGTYQDAANNGYNAFVAKFNSNGVRQWATFGPFSHQGNIACDYSGNVYNVGRVVAASSFVSAGAHQTTYGGGSGDAYLFKLSADGTSRLWCTLYGGSGDEEVNSNAANYFNVVCDPYNNVYISGTTTSSNAIATTGAHQTSLASTSDAFIAKFDSAGVRLWGTYYGGNAVDNIQGMAVGQDNKLYVSGDTYSANGIATTGAFRTIRRGVNDAFFSSFNANGQLTYGTYYGGNHYESAGSTFPTGNGIKIATSLTSTYIGGITHSNSFVATTGAYQTTFNGNPNGVDAFIAKFDADTSSFIVHPFTDTLLCGGDTLQVPYGVTQTHRSTNTFTVQLSNASGSFASGATSIGTLNSATADTVTCVMPTTLTPGTGYRIRIISSAPIDTSEDNGLNIKASTYPAAFSASIGTPICSGDTLYLNSSTTTSATTFTWSGPSSFTSAAEDTIIANTPVSATGTYYLVADHAGCVVRNTFSVLVNPSPSVPIATNNSTICGNDTLKLFSTTVTSGATYAWTGPLGFTSAVQNPVKPNVQPPHSGIYKVTVTLGSCTKEDTTLVKIDTAAIVNVFPTPGNDICDGTPVTLVAVTSHTGTTPLLQWTKNGSNISGATGTNYVATGIQNNDAYALVVTPSTTCKNPVTSNIINMTVTPVLTPSVSISANPGLLVAPWDLVTFTATPTNGGSSPTYQWKRNGQKVLGATNDTWGTFQLSDGDTISVVLYSDYKCPNPDSIESNKLIVNLKLGIDNINTLNSVTLFPNPNSGTFTIKGKVTTKEDIRLSIINSVGQVVHQQTITTTASELNQQINTNNLASGVYLLQLQAGNDKQHIRFTIN